MFFLDELAKYDKEIYDATCLELQRQRDNIELIASENIVSKAVLLAAGTILTNNRRCPVIQQQIQFFKHRYLLPISKRNLTHLKYFSVLLCRYVRSPAAFEAYVRLHLSFLLFK